MTAGKRRLIALAAIAFVVAMEAIVLLKIWERRQDTALAVDKLSTELGTIQCQEELLETPVEEHPGKAYPYLTPTEMDAAVTALLLRHGFTPQSLRVEEARSGAAQPYLSEEKGRLGKPYSGVPLRERAEHLSIEEIEKLGTAYFYTGYAAFSAVNGDWMALLDEVSRSKTMTMESFSISGSTLSGTVGFTMCGE